MAPDRDLLEQAILGGDPDRFTAPEVAAEAGVTIDQARKLWRALGFPEVVGEAYFTGADVDALNRIFGAVDAGTLDFDMALALTRALGQTMARLADWEVATLVDRIEEIAQDDTRSRHAAALRMVDEINPEFERLLVYAWRRHLAAAVARVEALGAREEDLHTTRVTVGFADIVHFTALTNKIGEDRIGDMVEIFEARCHDVVSNAGGRVIKSIGDSVLFVSETALRAFEIAEGIINVIGRDPRMPDVRVGLASGSVVTRMGDVFGPPVNLASRLTGVARRNRIIVDATTAALLPEDGFSAARLPARPVRGFGLVEPVSIRRR